MYQRKKQLTVFTSFTTLNISSSGQNQLPMKEHIKKSNMDCKSSSSS